MPTVTIREQVDAEKAAARLQEQLGSRYQVTRRGNGSAGTLKVKRSGWSSATVRLTWKDDQTTFHVHGGGVIIRRAGIASTVAAAISEAFGSASPVGVTRS